MLMFNKNKKNQISIFLIIGVILVIIAIFFLVTKDYSFFQSNDTKMKNLVSDTVVDCIEESSLRGLFLLGTQGGYINIPQRFERDPRSYTDFGFKIPNWDTQKGDIPTISSMENELEQFIITESMLCIDNNLKALEELYEIKNEGDIVVDASINEQNVVVEMNYPVEIKEYNGDSSITVSDYTVNIRDLRLGDLYNLAVEIYNLESETHLFEELTLDQIGSANDYSSPQSVPTEGMTFSCGRRIWTVPNIKQNVISLNNNNFKYLQFLGTYPKKTEYDLAFNGEYMSKINRNYYENFYTFPLFNQKDTFKNYDVDVFVPSIQVNNREGFFQRDSFRKFEVTPSSNGIVKSMRMEIDLGTQIPVPCIQVYHHLYTMDYDLIIKLTDYTQNSNQYFFQFPIRVKIDKNEPKVSSVPIQLEEPSTFREDTYCVDDQMLYPMYITAKDLDDNYLSDVNISYKCLNVKCDIGVTDRPMYEGVINYGVKPGLETDFPFCIGGQVIAEKTGYHTAKQRVDTDESLLRRETYYGDNYVELNMIPKKSFKVDAGTFLMIFRETGNGHRVKTEEDGSIYVTLKNGEYDFESSAFWPTDEGFMDKLEILDVEDAKYNISIFFMDSEQELRGFYELVDWVPNVNEGKKIQFTIPASIYPIKEDDYLDFFDYAVLKIKEDDKYKPVFSG